MREDTRSLTISKLLPLESDSSCGRSSLSMAERRHDHTLYEPLPPIMTAPLTVELDLAKPQADVITRTGTVACEE
jgi:hypothetical protein